MCLIAICHKEKLSLSDFNKIWAKNDDGFGIAKILHDKKKVIFKKGIMDREKAFQISQEWELPYTVHFRACSIGPKIPELTHPFIISKESPLDLEGEADSVLFQNGTVYLWDDYLAASGKYLEQNEKLDKWSDTRGIASIISGGNTRFLNRLNAKFIVLNPQNIEEPVLYWGEFDKINETYFSNRLWQNFSTKNFSNFNSGNKNKNLSKSQKIEILNNNGINYAYNLIGGNDWDNSDRILKFLLNKISKRSAQKLWNKFIKKNKDVYWGREQAFKVLKQQNPRYKKIELEKIVGNLSVVKPDEKDFIQDEKDLAGSFLGGDY